MPCDACGNCADYARRLVERWYQSDRSPRRTHEEVALEKDRKARAVAARKEFHARCKMEKLKAEESHA